MTDCPADPNLSDDEHAGAPIALPPLFLQWLRDNGVDPAVYAAAPTLRRYIRCRIVYLCLPPACAATAN